MQLESNGKEKHLYTMERAERSKFSQKMSKETTLAINHASRVPIRKSSYKKVCIINDPNNAPYKTPSGAGCPCHACQSFRHVNFMFQNFYIMRLDRLHKMHVDIILISS